jgi:LCP family protein required for cell wall assembly
MQRHKQEKQTESRISNRDALKVISILLVIFLCITAVTVPLTYIVFYDMNSGKSDSLLNFNLSDLSTTSNQEIETGIEEEIFNPPPVGIATPEPWDGADRVTMLLMGLDYRDWESGSGPPRTDTMLLLTIDPITKTGGMLSIPRDLWANIPGFNPNKINTAYRFGELYQVPGGGPALAIKTIEVTLGVPIDYYAQIDFSAFEDFIDLIGGVKLDIPEELTVDPLGDENPPQTLQPGIQVLPGYLALAYARARNTEGGDFDRAARQQQVVLRIRDRILDFNLLPNLITNAPEIYNELSSGIHTNIPLDVALKLAVLAIQIERENIQRGIIGKDHVSFGISPDNQKILIPLPDSIRILRDEIFAESSPLNPHTPGDVIERMQLEFARVSLQNGTSDPEIASRTADYLRNLGANIFEITSTDSYYEFTTILDHAGRPFTLQFLIDQMGFNSRRILHEYDPNHTADIEIKIGADWLNDNPLP